MRTLDKEKRDEILQALSEDAAAKARTILSVQEVAADSMNIVLRALLHLADVKNAYDEIAVEQRELFRYHFIAAFCSSRISLLREYVPFLGQIFAEDLPER